MSVPEKQNTREELEAEIMRLYEENERLKAGGMLTIKLHDKGTVSVYGLGRFPVSLYPEQWEKLLDAKDQIEDFLINNAEEIAAKAQR
jgi:hypothetical protein